MDCFNEIEAWLKRVTIVQPKWNITENKDKAISILECDYGDVVDFHIIYHHKKVRNNYEVHLYRQCVIRQEIADWFNKSQWCDQSDVIDWLKARLKRKYIV